MPEHPPAERPLADRIVRGADAGASADAVCRLWRSVDSALHPIIGHGGVAALFNRSIMLTAGAHPWMTFERCEVLADAELAALRAVLARQAAPDAEAGGRALLAAFEGLLVSLVGPSLSERLLQPVRQAAP